MVRNSRNKNEKNIFFYYLSPTSMLEELEVPSPSRPSGTGLIVAILIAGAMISGAIVYSANQDSDPFGLESLKSSASEGEKSDRSLEELMKDFEKYDEFENRMGEIFKEAGLKNEPLSLKGASKPAGTIPGTVNASREELVDNDPYLGQKDAPLTIVEFSDFECPYCKRYFSETFPKIKEQYIDTGKVRYVFRDYPIYGHQRALPAAMAAACVFEQKGSEGYLKMHGKIFENQQDLSDENLKKIAGEAGANGAKYDSCVKSGKFTAEIEADQAFGGTVGVTGTPGFVVGNKFVKGAQSFAYFQQVIEEQLK
ncbi:MAG: thioredoxin domain-containing protein [bacterium]|nr:thioredoxin domain-containing protein [bacterium]